ncbi:MAG: thiamine pyridinylase [Hyphomicrobiales bacterium]
MMTFRVKIFAFLAVFACFSLPSAALAQSCNVPCQDGQTCVAAGLYPYVPDTTAFATAICSAWSASGRSEELYLIADENVWDGGYSSDPVYTNGSGTQAPIDVFVYDAMYLEYWKTQTVSVPAASISDPTDFVPYAQTALTEANGDMFALPMLGCTNIMFYRQGDQRMEAVTTFSEFLSVNPAGVYISPVPFDDTGAMMNMSGKTTIGVDYMVRGYLTNNGQWPSMTTLDPAIIQPMTALAETASFYNALTGAIPPHPNVEDQYVRAGYFSDGYGRTSIGFSESMSQMSDTTRSQLRLRAFPWSDDTNADTMFYADVVGVNSSSAYLGSSGAAFFLANLMTQQAVMQASIAPAGGDLSYLFPARQSVLDTLAAQDPFYGQMSDVLSSATSVLVSMPTTDRDAFHSFGGTVEAAVEGAFNGSCDLESTAFPGSNAEAPAICTPLCANSGGWVGSWTNQSPPAWPGYSACGCQQCTAQSPLPTTVSEPSAMVVEGPRLRRYDRN